VSDKTRPPGTGAAYPGAPLEPHDADRTPSTEDSRPQATGGMIPAGATVVLGNGTPEKFVSARIAGRHHLADVDDDGIYRLPSFLRRIAYSAVMRFVTDHYDDIASGISASVSRDLAEYVCDALAPHFAAKDCRIAELVGQVQRQQAGLDGTAVAEDVHSERTADAASGPAIVCEGLSDGPGWGPKPDGDQ
jgi:hypothetical protein